MSCAVAAGGVALGGAHQDSIDAVIAGLRGIDRVEQARYTGAVEVGVGRIARPITDEGIVVLEELRLLGILEGNENHRVAARRDHTPGQSHHVVVVAANTDAAAQGEACFDIGNGLVVAP